jgi:hypothetical protein
VKRKVAILGKVNYCTSAVLEDQWILDVLDFQYLTTDFGLAKES